MSTSISPPVPASARRRPVSTPFSEASVISDAPVSAISRSAMQRVALPQACARLPSAFQKRTAAVVLPPGRISASWSKPTPRCRSPMARTSAGASAVSRCRWSMMTKSLPSPVHLAKCQARPRPRRLALFRLPSMPGHIAERPGVHQCGPGRRQSQPVGVPADVVFHEARDEEVRVVVAGEHAQGGRACASRPARPPAPRAGACPKTGRRRPGRPVCRRPSRARRSAGVASCPAQTSSSSPR